MTKIALLDYGMGNLHSVSKALTNVGAEVSITNDPKVVAAADKIVFPGVGAMRDCMIGMRGLASMTWYMMQCLTSPLWLSVWGCKRYLSNRLKMVVQIALAS